MAYLVVNFTNFDEYNRAIKWFDSSSDYTYDYCNSEFRCFYFSEENLAALEIAISDELNSKGFENYHFTLEDKY